LSEYKVKIIEKKVVAIDSVSLKFEIPESAKPNFHYKAGQFIGIQADINKEKVVRSYSLSSSPETDDYIQVTLKKVFQGKMSSFLVDDLKEGDYLVITPPVGHFVCASKDHHHILFAAGSGVTPIYSMIKSLLVHEAPKITLIYSNKNLSTTIFVDELKALQLKYPQLSIKWVFTQEAPDWEDATQGRLSSALLQSMYLLWQSAYNPVFYMCGPEGFMESIESFLGHKGYDSSQIKKESFVGTVSSLDADDVVVGQFNGQAEVCTEIKAEIDFSDCIVKPESGETVLEALLREGFDPPYSCLDGNCLACQCVVKEGAVQLRDTGILNEDDYKEGRILSCQAKAITKKLKVVYEF
jgi:ferredoxin-NADP reductase